jgi:hypothetical protein
MLGISCFVLASNALSCQSLGVTFASLVATTLCRANSDFSEFIACYQLVSQVARDQRPGIEQILGTRSECQDVAAHCSETCSACVSDADCADSLFCNGMPYCDEGLCIDMGNPCSGLSPVCDEAADACFPCTSNSECPGDDICDGASGACISTPV